MNLFAFAFLADENINPDVVAERRALGCDLATVAEVGMAAASDDLILRRAEADGRVILTHDPDFGRLALQAEAFAGGIVFVRPGHISSQLVLATLSSANGVARELATPFILTVEQKTKSGLRVRVRQLPSAG